MRLYRVLFATALFPVCAASTAQVQVNPQLGVTFQNLTDAPDGTEYKTNAGFILGADVRIGEAFYIQPGAFFGRNATTISVPVVTQDPNNPNATVTTEIEDGLIRSILKLRAQVGYKLINEEQFKLRFAVGPSYDVLLSVDSKDDDIDWNEGNFNNGSFNLDAGLGFDIAFLTLEPGMSFGLSQVYNDNVLVQDIDSKYITFYFTAGLVFGKGM
jgi:hypothetical protein